MLLRVCSTNSARLFVLLLCPSVFAQSRRVSQEDVEQGNRPPPEAIVQYVDYEDTSPPDKLPYPRSGVIPPGYVAVERRSLVQWLPGAIAVVALPLAGVGIAQTTRLDSAWIPVAGPWLALGELPPRDPTPSANGGLVPDTAPLGRVFTRVLVIAGLGLDGVVQAAGWGWLAYGCILTPPKRRYLEREGLASSQVVPSPLPAGGWGLQWVGTF